MLNTVGVKLSQEGPETGNSEHKNQRTLSSGTAVRMMKSLLLFVLGSMFKFQEGESMLDNISATSQHFQPTFQLVAVTWPILANGL